MEDKHPNQYDSIILDELKNLCVNICLLQAMKEIPTYNKFIKYSYMNNPRRNKKDPPTINVVGTLDNIMLK